MAATRSKPKKSATKTPSGARKAAKPKAKDVPSGGEASGEVVSFETALEQLEETVGRLESGEMPLEEALELFESGVRLTRQCNETLEAAERRIEVLVADRENGQAVEPFQDESIDLAEDPSEDGELFGG